MAYNELPEVLYSSIDLARAWSQGKVTPKLLREDGSALVAMQAGEVSNDFMRSMRGLPFYMSHTAPTEDSSPIAFNRHFNPARKHDSDYFASVNNLLTCVEAHAATATTEEEQNQVCGSEMKQVRLSALKQQLLYHHINKRFYMDLITRSRGEAPY